MRFVIPKLNNSFKMLMRQCGYSEIADSRAKESSYARSLNPGRFYPRFHIYFEQTKTGFIIKLHLDAKQPSYEGAAGHGGEYESLVVAEEAQRIKNIAEKFIPPAGGQKSGKLGFQPKKPWWKRLFG